MREARRNVGGLSLAIFDQGATLLRGARPKAGHVNKRYDPGFEGVAEAHEV
jgi:hypothetical protein